MRVFVCFLKSKQKIRNVQDGLYFITCSFFQIFAPIVSKFLNLSVNLTTPQANFLANLVKTLFCNNFSPRKNIFLWQRVVVQISNFHCYIRGFWSEISPEIVVGVLFFLSINHTLVLCMISPKNNKNNWCKVKLGITQCSKNAKNLSEVYQ